MQRTYLAAPSAYFARRHKQSSASKKLATNCLPLSVSIYVGAQSEYTQRSRNTLAISLAVVVRSSA